MNSTCVYAESMVTAAFNAVDMARRPRVTAWDTYVVPQRKLASGNQHIFMIQSGAVGAGASGPSPWGCPV